jgi:hypothetical protein
MFGRKRDSEEDKNVIDLAPSPASRDATVRLWDAGTDAALQTLENCLAGREL